MFDTFKQYLIDKNIKSMCLWVVDGSPTEAIYKSLGGKRTKKAKQDEIGGKIIDEIMYSFTF